VSQRHIGSLCSSILANSQATTLPRCSSPRSPEVSDDVGLGRKQRSHNVCRRRLSFTLDGVPSTSTQVAIALGSNEGDRLANLAKGLKLMSQAGVRVERVSSLYQTEPAYVEDQPRFLNAAVLAYTDNNPHELLDLLKSIELQCGRQPKGVRFGPRTLDLDLLLYGSYSVRSERLQIPHPRMHERPFVLAPLADLASSTHPSSHGTSCIRLLVGEIARRWRAIEKEAFQRGLLERVTVVGERIWPYERRPYIMGVLNVTPDSFSDGGSFQDCSSAVSQAAKLLADGADIIDIGGQSTRPGAQLVSPDDELGRILPVIQALKKSDSTSSALLSVDTFYGKVADAAVAAGVHAVNDVSGGALDEQMLPAIAKMAPNVPYIMMHMRGDPSTMQLDTNLSYSSGVVQSAALELVGGVTLAAKMYDVCPWRLWIDPGIGFAKSHHQNLELLGHLDGFRDIVNQHILANPVMVLGASRKGFLGTITGKPKEERDVATAACSLIGAPQGVHVHRVHNVAVAAEALSVLQAVRDATTLTGSVDTDLSIDDMGLWDQLLPYKALEP